jgi:hypothetical protein
VIGKDNIPVVLISLTTTTICDAVSNNDESSRASGDVGFDRADEIPIPVLVSSNSPSPIPNKDTLTNEQRLLDWNRSNSQH